MNDAVAVDEAPAPEKAFFDRLRPLATSYSRSSEVRRIAVVGNQPLSPSTERAETIDSADLVFRVNGFRSDEEEAVVGSRTD
ncbi:MAG: glycosyltransferase family 29 protein, partial [Microbacterium sp.]